MKIIYETPRLLLREFTEADAPIIFALNSDQDVLKYIHEPELENEQAALAIIRNIILPQYVNRLGRWAIHTKQNNEFIGWCGLKFRPELNETDLGYRLKRSAWGNGYATEAANGSLHYGFDTLNLQLIIGRAHIQNIASVRVLEKIGMCFVREEIVDDCPVKTYTKSNPSTGVLKELLK